MTRDTMTLGELRLLLADNGLPATTPVSVRVMDGSSFDGQHSTGYGINRVQVVRLLQTAKALASGHNPEFVLEIIAVKPTAIVPGQPHRPLG